MPGNFDGIIRQVLGMNDPDTGEPMATVPPTTARVPQNVMRDTPFYESVPPDVGSETTPKVVSNQDLDAAKQLARLRELSDQMHVMSRGSHDPTQFNQLMDEFNTLDTQYRAYTDRDRNVSKAIDKAVPGDVDTMMQAIQRRQQLGRSEP